MAKRTDTKLQRGKMKPEDEKCMRTYITEILEIEPRHIIDYMYGEDIISYEDKQSIDKKGKRRDRADELVSTLLDRGPNAFDGFLRALVKGRYLQLASKLKTMAEAIKYDRGQIARPTKIPVVSVIDIAKDKDKPKKKDQIVYQRPQKSTLVAKETNYSTDDTNPKRLIPVVPVKQRESEEKFGRLEVEDTPLTDESIDSSRAPTEHDESMEQDTASEIYKSLNTTYCDINNQVESILPLLGMLKQTNPEMQGPNIAEGLKNEMEKVKEEKSRLDQSPRQEQRIFNRDMILLIRQMNKALSHMSGVLLKLVRSLQESDTKSKEIIDKMQNEIADMKQQLEEKNQQLAEIERDRCAERQGFMTDVKAALTEQRKQVLKDLHKEKEAEKVKREKEEKERKREEQKLREQDKKDRDEHRRNLEEDRRQRKADLLQMERMKEEMERMSEDGVSRDVKSRENANRGPGETKEADRKSQLAPNRDVFIPRTGKTSLPVRGKAFQRQPREEKK